MNTTAITTLSQFGVLGTKSAPVLDPKISFAKYATQAIQALQSGASHNWFAKKQDGSVSVQFKRGVKPILIGGHNQITCPNITQAVNLLTQAQVLVANGQLDAELEAAKPEVDLTKPRKARKSRKTAEAAAE